jgi:hypothetical protein
MPYPDLGFEGPAVATEIDQSSGFVLTHGRHDREARSNHGASGRPREFFERQRRRADKTDRELDPRVGEPLERSRPDVAADIARDAAPREGQHGEHASLVSRKVERVAAAGQREREIGLNILDRHGGVDDISALRPAETGQQERRADRRGGERSRLQFLARCTAYPKPRRKTQKAHAQRASEGDRRLAAGSRLPFGNSMRSAGG